MNESEERLPPAASPIKRPVPKVLVADDNPLNRSLLSGIFEAHGFEPVLASDGDEALSKIADQPPSVVLMDLRMPGVDGLQALRRIKRTAPRLPVIMLTAHGDVSDAVEAIKLGAYDFLVRPVNNDQLVVTVRRALERSELETEVEDLRRQLQGGGALFRFATPSGGIQRIVHQIEQVAGSELTVLIQGETGTGKELVARAIHQTSARHDKPFVAIDCGAIPENLLESELFGHEKGAFSGAERRREGHFQLGDGGTIFLDEVANLPLTIQSKLLRVIQERQVQPLGSSRAVPLNVRFVAAANEALDAKASKGLFREDLYYRLAEFTIFLPPLRDRKEDIVVLANRFQEEASLEMRRLVNGISEAGVKLLMEYAWPGNVRELRNVMRQVVLQAPGPVLDAQDLRQVMTKRSAKSIMTAPVPISGGIALREISETAATEAEKQAIVEALRATRGNKSKAARMLKVDYKTLHVKIKRYGLQAAPE